MANVLADLAIALMHLSAQHGDDGSPMRRIATTVMEYWGCGRVTGHLAEAMHCLGGNGYSEASGLPRLLRDAAVHPIWEGSGDVVALDTGRLAESPKPVRAAWSRIWPSGSSRLCSCASPPPPLPMPTARDAWGPTAAWLTAPCPPKSIRAPSSIVRFPHERRLIPEIESRRTVLSAHEPSA